MKKLLGIILVTVILATMSIVPAFAAYEELEDFTMPDTGVLFKFDGNAEDAFGNLNGTASDTVEYVEGRDGTPSGAAMFDEVDDFVMLLKNDHEGDWTANFWVYKIEHTKYNFLLISLGYSLRLDQNGSGGYPIVGVTLHGIVDEITDVHIETENWTMLTFVHSEDDVTISVYVNGEYMADMFNTMPLPLTLLGNDDQIKGWDAPLMAALDDVWLLPRALSEAEVGTLYSSGEIAGITIPGSEPEPEPEPEPAADEPAPAEEASAPAPAAPTTAPPTSDFSLVIISAGIAISAIGLAISSKKRRV